MTDFNSEQIKMSTICNIQLLEYKLRYKQSEFKSLDCYLIEKLEQIRDNLVKEYNQIIKEGNKHLLAV